MSRLAKKPIIIPAKTEVSFDGTTISVKGPLGTITKNVRPYVNIDVKGTEVMVTPKSNSLETKALVGTTVAHIKNMISGVNKIFEKKLIIEGIGYKADLKGTDLVLAVGFSHLVTLPVPAELKVVSEKSGITVSGMDIEKVGQFAAQVRATKKPEPYLGKGIRYSDEVIRRKQGKKAA